MENKQPEKQPLENIIGGLRDEYMHQSPTLVNSEAPKLSKARRQRFGHWLLILAALIILSGTAVIMRQTADTDSETRGVVEGVTLEDWEDYIDPTFPATTAIPLPEEEVEPIPAEATPALPEVTPWPTPPITPP